MTRTGLLCLMGLCSFRSAQASDPGAYELTGPAATLAGGRGTASVTITAKPGWHINEKAPLTLTVVVPPGLVVRKTKLARADLKLDTRERARFDISISCRACKPTSMTVEARFVICKEESCNPQRQTLTIAVEMAGRTLDSPTEPKAEQRGTAPGALPRR